MNSNKITDLPTRLLKNCIEEELLLISVDKAHTSRLADDLDVET